MKTAIVTGAGGFIGKTLVKKLVQENIYVYAITTNKKGLLEFDGINNVCIVETDFKNSDFVKDIGKKVDVFFHLAWKGISALDYKNIDVQKHNIEICINAVKAAVKVDCKKFIFLGTNQEYLMDYNEIDGENSISSIYGVCKMSCNNLCKVMLRNKMKYCSTIFTNVYGIGDKSKRTANLFISKLSNKEDLDLIEGDNMYDWTYVDDAVEGLIAVAKNGKGNRSYYIGSRKLKTFKEIIEEVRDIISPNGILKFGAFQDTSFTDYSLIDLDALYNDTGFECKADFKESILKTAQWVKTLDF